MTLQESGRLESVKKRDIGELYKEAHEGTAVLRFGEMSFPFVFLSGCFVISLVTFIGEKIHSTCKPQ